MHLRRIFKLFTSHKKAYKSQVYILVYKGIYFENEINVVLNDSEMYNSLRKKYFVGRWWFSSQIHNVPH